MGHRNKNRKSEKTKRKEDAQLQALSDCFGCTKKEAKKYKRAPWGENPGPRLNDMSQKERKKFQQRDTRLNKEEDPNKQFHSKIVRISKKNLPKEVYKQAIRLKEQTARDAKPAMEYHHLRKMDHLKSPMGDNNTKPQSLSPASDNTYYALNLEEKVVVVDGKKITKYRKTNYGDQTGAISVNLNPDTLRIEHMIPPIYDMGNNCRELGYITNPGLEDVVPKTDINHAAAKDKITYNEINYSIQKTYEADKFMDTGYHQDMTFRDGEYADNNSQKKYSMVFMLTIGATQRLTFQLVDKNGLPAGRTIIRDLKHLELFMLDPRDEQWKGEDGLHWVHSASLVHKRREDTTTTFVFRTVTSDIWVKEDGTLFEPKFPGDKEKVFRDPANLSLMEGPAYERHWRRHKERLKNTIQTYFNNKK